MKRILGVVVGAYLVLALAGVLLVFSGIYDIGATSPHWRPIYWVMEQARMRSIEAHAAGIQEPANFHDPALLALGTAHFAAHCVVCHGGPGVPRNEIAEGMYPLPPDLAVTVNHYTAPELFWIVKHGIKMTGMPGWSDHTDEELWATVAFIRKLPGMSEADYGKLVMASMMHGGHHHGGMEMPDGAAPMPPDMPGMDMRGTASPTHHKDHN